MRFWTVGDSGGTGRAVTVGRITGAALAGLVIVSGLVTGAQTPARQAENVKSGCVGRFDPETDYFPDKAVIEDAANFRVEYQKSYKLVTVRQAGAGGPAESYVLVQCGAPAPKLAGALAGAHLVVVPIASLFVSSPTHLAPLADLDRIEVLTGVARRDAVMDPRAEARIRAGKVVEFAKVGLVPDVERVVAERPSLLMASATSGTALAVIRSAGVPVVINTEWLESTALGRAEWLKYMALFLNEEGRAQALYRAMSDRYRLISTRAQAGPESARPLVMTGRSTRGVFVIAGGRSYVASLIADAGGRYAWADNTSAGTASIDLEAQIQRAANADVWINGGGWTNQAAMLENEPRYREFKAYRQGQVWVYERREMPGGGNDYWSRSVTHPDLLLADLVKIFHPALAKAHEFEWYKPVAR